MNKIEWWTCRQYNHSFWLTWKPLENQIDKNRPIRMCYHNDVYASANVSLSHLQTHRQYVTYPFVIIILVFFSFYFLWNRHHHHQEERTAVPRSPKRFSATLSIGSRRRCASQFKLGRLSKRTPNIFYLELSKVLAMPWKWAHQAIQMTCLQCIKWDLKTCLFIMAWG